MANFHQHCREAPSTAEACALPESKEDVAAIVPFYTS